MFYTIICGGFSGGIYLKQVKQFDGANFLELPPMLEERLAPKAVFEV